MNSSEIIVDIKIRSIGVDCQLNEGKKLFGPFVDRFFFHITKFNFICVVRISLEDFNIAVTSTQHFIFMSTNFWSNCFNVFFSRLFLKMDSGHSNWERNSFYQSCWFCVGVGYNEMMQPLGLWLCFTKAKLLSITSPLMIRKHMLDPVLVLMAIFFLCSSNWKCFVFVWN